LPEHRSRAFWAALFGPEGKLGSFDAILNDIDLVRSMAAAGVRSAADIVLEGLGRMSPKQRQELLGDTLHGLVSLLREMMLTPDCAEAAFQALGLLAEAEAARGRSGGYISDIFFAAAYPMNSQMPLRLDRRLIVLQGLFSPDRPEVTGVLAVEAAFEALGSGGRAIPMTPSRGALPGGGYPKDLTWDEVFAYQRNLLAEIGKSTNDSRSAVRIKAKSRWATAAENQIYYGGAAGIEAGLNAFGQIVDQIVQDDREFSVSEVVETINLCRVNLDRFLPDQAPGNRDEIVAALRVFLKRLLNGSFDLRLRLRLGRSWGGIDDGGNESIEGINDGLSVQGRAISALAEEACGASGSLSPTLIEWTLSDEAIGSSLFWEKLGEHDVVGGWHEVVVDLARRYDSRRMPALNGTAAP
jgi:hypothetical protein